jgi:hypothetical protein
MSRGPGIMQREILRRAQARRNAFTVLEMAAKLFTEIDDTRLGAVRRATRGLEAMGYLSRDDQGRYHRTSKRQPTQREWVTPVEIVQVGFDEADKILADGNHYLGPAGWKRGYVLTTPTRDALAIFAPPVAAHFNRVLEMPLELTRLWRSDDCPFVLSQFLSRALRWIKREVGPCSCVFSYADPAARNPRDGREHHGGIHAASNFVFIGTSHRTGYWLTSDGTRITLPQCYRRFKTKSVSRVAVLRPSWQFVPGERKNLFVFPMQMAVATVLDRIGGSGKRYNGSLGLEHTGRDRKAVAENRAGLVIP